MAKLEMKKDTPEAIFGADAEVTVNDETEWDNIVDIVALHNKRVKVTVGRENKYWLDESYTPHGHYYLKARNFHDLVWLDPKNNIESEDD